MHAFRTEKDLITLSFPFLIFLSPYFKRVSLSAQLEKNLPAMRETWVRSLGWEDPLGKGKTTHSSILAWKTPWTLYSPWACKELDTTEQLSLLYLKKIPRYVLVRFKNLTGIWCWWEVLDNWRAQHSVGPDFSLLNFFYFISFSNQYLFWYLSDLQVQTKVDEWLKEIFGAYLLNLDCSRDQLTVVMTHFSWCHRKLLGKKKSCP